MEVITRHLTETPMNFKKELKDGRVLEEEGVGYILWNRRDGRDEKFSTSKDCETQLDADRWAINMQEIYDCHDTPRMKATRAKMKRIESKRKYKEKIKAQKSQKN